MNILEERWKETDQYIIEYLNGYKNINKATQKEIQQLFNSLEITQNDLNKPIPPKDQIIVDEAVKEIAKDENFTGYFKYRISELYSERMNYKNYIETMLLIAEIKELSRNIDDIKVLIKKSAKSVRKQAEQELEESYPEAKLKPFSLGQEIMLTLVGGYTLLQYIQAWALTYQQEIMKQCLIDIQQQRVPDITKESYQTIIQRQTNKLLNVNEETGAVTGGLDPYIITIGNQTYIDTVGTDTGKTTPEAETNQDKTNIPKEKETSPEPIKVRFIAQHDSKTTPMCKSMDNMIFLVNGRNKFQRYSAEEKGMVDYDIYGLQSGINLPPINDHFHWCRSTITYQWDDWEKIEYIRETGHLYTEYEKEQYNRYKTYFGESIGTIEEFVRMKYENKQVWEKLKKDYYEMRRNHKYKEEVKADK